MLKYKKNSVDKFKSSVRVWFSYSLIDTLILSLYRQQQVTVLFINMFMKKMYVIWIQTCKNLLLSLFLFFFFQINYPKVYLELVAIILMLI